MSSSMGPKDLARVRKLFGGARKTSLVVLVDGASDAGKSEGERRECFRIAPFHARGRVKAAEIRGAA